ALAHWFQPRNLDRPAMRLHGAAKHGQNALTNHPKKRTKPILRAKDEYACGDRSPGRNENTARHGAAFRRRGVDPARRQVARRAEAQAADRGPPHRALQGAWALADRRAARTRRSGTRRARPLDRLGGAWPPRGVT